MTNVQIGAVANDGTGDPLRVAMSKINTNFNELVPLVGSLPGPVFPVRSFGAIPNSGVCAIVAIQAAIEAASAVGGTVLLEEGTYDLDPYNIVYPARTSEAHQSCLSIWANDVKIVGAGGYSTILRVKNELRNGSNVIQQVNMIGSGGKVVTGDGADTGFSGIVLSGFCLDANNFYEECTQIYNPTNWIISDVGVKNTVGNCDGFDIQYGDGVVLNNVYATDITDNAISGQTPNIVVDGFLITRCGKSLATNAALEFPSNPPPVMSNVTMVGCKYILSPGGWIDLRDSYIESTNADAAHNVFEFSSPTTGRFRNVTIVTPIVTDGAIIKVSGGTVFADGVVFNNWKPGINMSSGSLWLSKCTLGEFGGQRPIVVNGGTVRMVQCVVNGGAAQRDFRMESGTITNAVIAHNSFIGVNGVDFDSLGSTGLVFDHNVVYGDGYFAAAAGGQIRNNSFLSTVRLVGSFTFSNNYVAGAYARDGGAPVMLNGNVFANAASVTEIQEALPAYNAITPTTTTTTYTNNNPFPVDVYFRGGTIDSVAKNGTQIYGVSTAGNSVRLAFGEYVTLTNSVTAGMVVNWVQAR